MKPKLSFLCLLLSVSPIAILPILAGEAAKPAPKSEEEVKNQQIAGFYVAMSEKIFAHLNSEPSLASRFSRVVIPMSENHYYSEIVSHDADGNISFRILHVDRRDPQTRLKPNTVATGTYINKTMEVYLLDDQTGKSVPASEHALVKNAKQSKVGKLDPSTIQTVKP